MKSKSLDVEEGIDYKIVAMALAGAVADALIFEGLRMSKQKSTQNEGKYIQKVGEAMAEICESTFESIKPKLEAKA